MYKLGNLIYSISLILSDVGALFASFLIAYYLRSNILPVFISRFEQTVSLPLETQLRYGFLYGCLFVVFVLSFEKLYSKRFSFWDETRHLLTGISFAFILLMMTVYVSRGYTQYSRAAIILTWILSLMLFPLFRLISRKLLFKINFLRKKVLIIGTNELAKLIAQEIKRNWTLGYEVLGFLSKKRSGPGKKTESDIKTIGEIDQVEQLSKKLGVRDLIISLPGISQKSLLELVEKCEQVADTIRIVPDIGNLFTMGIEIENWGDVLSLSMARNLVKPWNIFIKKSFEFITTLFLLIFFLPILLIIALAIKIDSRGSVFFVQERLGWRDKTFNFFKFRSMYVDGDLRLNKYLKENLQAKDEWKKYLKIKKNDPRVTRVGKFIRKYSLDELPQLINILKGNMSLVGPRPYMPREIEKIGKSHEIISRVKPGITGLWQVRGRNILPFKKRLLLDEYYIRNWSLWLDIVILFKTMKVLITREGAY